MKSRKRWTARIIAVALSFAGLNAGAIQPRTDIIDTAIAHGDFDTLMQAVRAAGLLDELKGDGPFTVLAPTDDAFAKIPADQLHALMIDKHALSTLVAHHILPGKVMAAELAGLNSAATVRAQSVEFRVRSGVVFVDGAQVLVADILTSNGVIHAIDTVILPH